MGCLLLQGKGLSVIKWETGVYFHNLFTLEIWTLTELLCNNQYEQVDKLHIMSYLPQVTI